MQILDGSGRGFRARVSDSLRLLVESMSRPSVEVAAEDGDAFILHAECHTAAATSGGFLFLTNDDNNADLVIERIFFDAHTLTPTDLIILQVKEPVPTGGTDISDSGIIQKNYGSGGSLDATLKQSDASSNVTYTGGEQYWPALIISRRISCFSSSVSLALIPHA